ncbi:excisionase family DNA-binding protein [Deinococcus marmoris]|uniref:excisionase family DNA-binding protein n=1 Tax=Deinococcus marmoris TaxID=249408 RepID=UPI000495D8BC|nr:helix-turn-helix domain-containing protein [Deinococcus marmoris]
MTALPNPLPLPNEQDRLHARELLGRLSRGQQDTLRVADLPTGTRSLLETILQEVAQGHAVQVVPVQAELGTQDAADLLGVSRPHLVKLLDDGALASWKVGTHRRVRLDDLLVYRARRDVQRQQALQELADLDQELGLT